nr:hypothetical protein [Bradyrhizobium barranii]
MDATHTANRADPMCCPGLTHAGGQAHPIERGGDVLVRPAPGHAADNSQGIFRRGGTVFTGARLADPKLGVLPTLPMDREHNVAYRIVDVRDDVDNQGSQQLLARAHRHIRGFPGYGQVIRQIGKGAGIDRVAG